MTTAPHLPAKAHSSDNVHRPKGILKNNSDISVPTVMPIAVPTIPEGETKDITLQNTLQNAGPRRSSSTTKPGSSARRQSAASLYDENEPRLKWDEANLYLTEQERTAKMKIDEPKTPYAPHYDPSEDDEEMQLAESQETFINAQDVVVDELDRKKVSEDEIPDFELGEPEESLPASEAVPDQRIYRDRSMSNESAKSEKHVHVGNEPDADDGLITTAEAKEKHRKFEKQRKMHYEMRNIKELLAHPEDEDEDDEMTGA